MNKMDHIGIAVKDIEASIRLFSKLLGVAPEATQVIDNEHVKICFFNLHNIKIELLQATQSASSIARFIDRHGEGIHHVAFEEPDMERCLEQCQQNGFEALPPGIRPGAYGKEIVFLDPKTTNRTLVELCRKKKG